jgi:hypothetical protein
MPKNHTHEDKEKFIKQRKEKKMKAESRVIER